MRSRGYQLQAPLELLNREVILEALGPAVPIEWLDVFQVIDSTSERLRSMRSPDPGKLCAVLAEYQTRGRGRRGREWLSPFGSGICLSVGWRFTDVPPTLPAMSLAAGVAVNRALQPMRPAGLGLKWPNDIIAAGGKLGGLLVDVSGESGGPITAIIGLGINIDVPEALRGELSRSDGAPPAGLRHADCTGHLSRNVVAANIIGNLQTMLVEFSHTGFESFHAEWRDFDCMRGKPVTVQTGSGVYTGIAAGISADGALLLDEDGEMRSLVSGEVTLRLAS